jgi:hypothetical protein
MSRSTAAAKRRAHQLLCDILSDSEYAQLILHNFVEVRSPSIGGRVYRIPAVPGTVVVYEDGHAIGRLCLVPVEPLPDDDLIALHKLFLECSEQAYLASANHLR